MTRYSVQPRDWLFVKGYRFFTTMRKKIGRDITDNLSSEYSPKVPNHAKQFATDATKAASKRIFQKAAEATADLIKFQVSRRLTQNCSERVESETENTIFDKEIPKERNVSQKKTASY